MPCEPRPAAAGGARRELGGIQWLQPVGPRGRVERFGRSWLAASFQDVVLVDLAVAVDPRIEVVFFDTGVPLPRDPGVRGGGEPPTTPEPDRHHPGPGPRLAVRFGPVLRVAKVAPAGQALAGREAWLTALKRVDAPTRAAAPIVRPTTPSGWSRSTRGDVDRRRHRPATSTTTQSRVTR